MTVDRLSRTSKKSSAAQSLHDSILQSAPRARGGNRSPDVGVISIAELRNIRSQAIKGEKSDAIVIRANDLDDIKQRFTIKSKEDIQREKIEKASLRENLMFAATQRKKKMMEMDAERASKVPLSDISLENKLRADGLLSRA